MTPKKTTKKEPADISKAVSVMGRKKFQEEVTKEAASGIPVGEAADLVARRKLKGYI